MSMILEKTSSMKSTYKENADVVAAGLAWKLVITAAKDK